MSSTRQRNRPGSAGEVALPAGIIGLVLLVVGGPWAAMSLASRFTHAPAPEANPFASFFQLVRGQIEWTTAATFAAVALGLAGVFMLVLVLVLRSRLRGGRGRAQSVDRAAQHMGRGRDVESLSRRAASDTAVRLGADKDQLGLPPGTSRGDQPAAVVELGEHHCRRVGNPYRQDNLDGHPLDHVGTWRLRGDVEQEGHRGRDPRPSCGAGHGVGL